MRRLLRTLTLVAALAATFFILAPRAQAHGWDFAVDTPVLFIFDKSGPNNPATANSSLAKWTDTSTTSVSGSKVMLTTPLHIGIGYEDYNVSQNFNVVGAGGPNGAGHATINIQMVDIALHLPISAFNLTIGGGQGQASFDAVLPPGAPATTAAAHHANAQQLFLVLGAPLGKHWDIHLGYHWISVEKIGITSPGQAPPFDQLQASGQMLSAGLQYSWGK